MSNNKLKTSITDELTMVMNGDLNCDDNNLHVYIDYCKRRINALNSFINDCKEHNVKDTEILNMCNAFINKVEQFQTFLNWCKTERKQVI